MNMEGTHHSPALGREKCLERGIAPAPPSPERLEAGKRILTAYNERCRREFHAAGCITVEQAILSILVSPRIRSGSLRNLGLHRDPCGSLVALPQNESLTPIREINYSVRNQLPIEALLPAYTFKSRNTSRAYAQPYDLAEIAGLSRLALITDLIKAVYPPGMRFTIIADGLRSSEIYLGASLPADSYRQVITELIWALGISNAVCIRELDEFLPKNFQEVCNRWVEHFSKSENQQSAYAQRILRTAVHSLDWSSFTPEDVTDLTRAVVAPDHPLFDESRIKGIRYLAMQEAVRELEIYKSNFPHHIRCTLHPKPSQLGIHLVNPESRIPPWHGTCGVRLDGTPVTGYRKDFEASPTWIPIFCRGDPFPFYYKQLPQMSDNPAIVFSAGKGERLSPLTTREANSRRIFPKPVVPIGNIPNIKLLLENASSEGLRAFAITLGYRAVEVGAVLNSCPGDLAFVQEEEEKKPKLARNLATSVLPQLFHRTDMFWVFHTDVVCPALPLGNCYRYFCARRELDPLLLGCMGVVFKSYEDFKIERDKSGAFTSLLLDKQERITRIIRGREIDSRVAFLRLHERFCSEASSETARFAFDDRKGPLLPTNASFYLLTKPILEEGLVNERVSFDVDVFGALPGQILAFPLPPTISERWCHLGYSEDVQIAQQIALDHPELYSATLLNTEFAAISIRNCIISDGASLKGRIILERCVCGEACDLADVEAKRSTFLPGTKALALHLDDCILSGDFSSRKARSALGRFDRLSHLTLVAGADGRIYFTNHLSHGKYPELGVL